MPRSCLVRPAGAARGGGWSVERWVRWVGAALPASDSAQMHHASAAAGTLGGPYVAPRGVSTKRRRCREFDACDGACGHGPVLSSTVLVVRGSSLGGCGGRPSAEAGAVADELAVRGEHHAAVGASDLCGPVRQRRRKHHERETRTQDKSGGASTGPTSVRVAACCSICPSMPHSLILAPLWPRRARSCAAFGSTSTTLFQKTPAKKRCKAD